MARPKPNLTQKQLRARSAMWVKKWRDANPDKYKLARRRAYLNRKLRAFNIIGEAKCKKCGCDELDYLEFNHINGGGAKEFRERLTLDKQMGMADLLLTGKRNADGLDILCRVCNALEFLERKNNKHIGRFKIIWK